MDLGYMFLELAKPQNRSLQSGGTEGSFIRTLPAVELPRKRALKVDRSMKKDSAELLTLGIQSYLPRYGTWTLQTHPPQSHLLRRYDWIPRVRYVSVHVGFRSDLQGGLDDHAWTVGTVDARSCLTVERGF